MKTHSPRNHNLRKKLKSQHGESIAEVLVAVLVVAFGALLLATMVTTCFKILNKSKTSYESYLAAGNVVAAKGEDSKTGFSDVTVGETGYQPLSGTLQVKVKLPDNSTGAGESESVTIYSVTKGNQQIYMDYALGQAPDPVTGG